MGNRNFRVKTSHMNVAADTARQLVGYTALFCTMQTLADRQKVLYDKSTVPSDFAVGSRVLFTRDPSGAPNFFNIQA